MKFTIPRGTKDILPSEIGIWQFVEHTAQQIFEKYAYREIRTPIFENTALFNRVIGDQSDIIQKEMYSFTDKGNRELSLRPEGTAPIARAYLTNQLQQQGNDLKLYYKGPMFRYERPQAGRYRQFHQIGIERINVNHPYADAEVIAMSYEFFKAIGLKKCKNSY
ncbi:hypothetical protein DID76_01180 [Candidatus Marinamargulisbacteria bacterium SCGC AG-414-C22]|nr:hypothetical protein DID76_01180 [Candidatus Marinamargulisbacteria bacterium SCGC AG-414-C22]